jgi:hypothetical protein
LNSGKAVDSKPAIDNSNKGLSAGAPDSRVNPTGSESTPKAQESKANSSSSQASAKSGESNANSAPQEQSGTTTPAKKKGRFHILKKIIKPI